MSAFWHCLILHTYIPSIQLAKHVCSSTCCLTGCCLILLLSACMLPLCNNTYTQVCTCIAAAKSFPDISDITCQPPEQPNQLVWLLKTAALMNATLDCTISANGVSTTAQPSSSSTSQPSNVSMTDSDTCAPADLGARLCARSADVHAMYVHDFSHEPAASNPITSTHGVLSNDDAPKSATIAHTQCQSSEGHLLINITPAQLCADSKVVRDMHGTDHITRETALSSLTASTRGSVCSSIRKPPPAPTSAAWQAIKVNCLSVFEDGHNVMH